MRLLLVSDLHYALRQLDWVARRAPDFDVVVLAGDQLDIASAVPLDAQVALFEAFLERLGRTTTVVVCSGNHDLDGPDEHGEQTARWIAELAAPNVIADGATVDVAGALLTVCPWWDGPLARQRVDAQLERDARRDVRPWIWVYHWPPTGSPTTWTGSGYYGDQDLAGWIARHEPDLVLAGHVHEPPFREGGSWVDRIGRTWVFNPGRQIGPEPAHVEIDLAARVACWRWLEGAETVDLGEERPTRRVLTPQ
jgi:Icc-related predicted phosphoesterase